MSASTLTKRKRIATGVETDPPTADIFCVRFSPDAKHICAGCGDSKIRVYNTSTGLLLYTLADPFKNQRYPYTCIRYRPVVATTKTRNVIIAANADGTVSHWHVTSGKSLHTIKEEDNEIFAVDYRPDAKYFCTAGRDHKVRVYDESTKQLLTTMSSGHGNITAGHGNRVFSAKFHPEDENIIVTGGWDNTVQIWDIRVEYSIRSIYGPHLCGDSVDMEDGVILSGSWRPDDQLQLWDFSTGRLIETIPWPVVGSAPPCSLYAAQFSKDSSLIAAGGSGSNEVKVFDRATSQPIGGLSGLERGIYTLDFAPDTRRIACAGADMPIRILNIVDAE